MTDDKMLGRKEVAEELNKLGYPISASTMATKSSRFPDKMPPYRLFGRTALYRWGDVLRWLETAGAPSKAGRNATSSN